jgi:hypothetical protein
MMPAHDNRELTVDEVLSQCRRMVPVNVLVPIAIEAHQEAVRRLLTAREISFALSAIVLACAPTVEDSREQLDYLVTVPLDHWPAKPQQVDNLREAQLGAIRRTIAWQQLD